jgi:hypothetical protein
MAEEKKGKPVPGLRVRALVEGFRRAGRAWSVLSVDVPLADFKKDEVAALRAEPQLVVEDCEL